MHQVRYFLALAHTLNFTRAAEECHVTQPSLTRAIKLLEHELGGDLLRRERGLTHLTPLGERMLPILTQCYESAVSAKAIATAMKERKVAALRLALPHSVDVAPFLPHIFETMTAFTGLALKIVRGDQEATEAALREGRADLAICGPGAMDWERFESWPLFDEPLRLAVPAEHRLSNADLTSLDALSGTRFVLRRYCESCAAIEEALTGSGFDLVFALEAGDDRDLVELVASGAGVGVVPASLQLPTTLRAVDIEGFGITRELRVWSVQGRERSAPAALLLTQLRAADWSAYRLEAA